MAFASTAAETVLKGFLGMTTSVILSNCYIGLGTGSGTTFTEVTAASYRRQLLGQSNQSATQLMTVTGNTATNLNNIIMFPESEESWGTVTQFGLFTAQTGGTPLIYGDLTTGVSVPTGYVPLFRKENFTLTLT